MVFKHPGTTMSPEMTFSLAADKDGDHERKRAFDRLCKECRLGYAPRALSIVDIDWGGKGAGHDEVTKDGEMAFMAALMYWCTMDERYGQMSINILRAWGQTNKVFKGNNAPLEAAWAVCSMARAAELLKHAKSPAIRAAWARDTEVNFIQWIDRVIMPILKNKAVWGWKDAGNWHFSIICARAQLAILRDDVIEWDWCVQTYKDALKKTLGHGGCPCHISETKRDVTHAQFQIGGILQFPEMAYHQGYLDIFNRRLAEVCEYHAAIMLKEVPPGIQMEDIKTPYGYWNEPVWELALAHFKGREAIPLPKCEAWLKTFRPERVCFHWGAGTLTHFNRTKLIRP